ncbi:hypothetical protein Moror_5107 [Moniliophthora roreri MCA 2997]|uniref:Uncharacterized protein n=1 Tax=Moniliophthora roreri (strain MCA 2997) TaxID=1381753 RepID=V2WLX0_MONRO|nr:hypothetical protein Moror_5107 [Moniliophthora roreri MCA 2997]
MGPTTVPVPVLDVENLPVHVEIPKDDDEPFPSSEDINPNKPAFFHEMQRTRRRLQRAIVVACGQCLLQTRQRLRLAPTPSHSNSQSTNNIPESQNELIYPPESSSVQTSDNSGTISNATERARLFPSTSPCTTPPPMLQPGVERPISPSNSHHEQRFDPANQFDTADEPVNSRTQVSVGRQGH